MSRILRHMSCRLSPIAWGAMGALLLTACVDGPPAKEPRLFPTVVEASGETLRLSGQILDLNVYDERAIGIAIIWFHGDQPIGRAVSSVGVGRDEEGTSFDLTVRTPPLDHLLCRDECLSGTAVEGRDDLPGFLTGLLIAYEDVNDNRLLDCFRAIDDNTCTDRLIGGANNLVVIYSDGAWPQGAPALHRSTSRTEAGLLVQSEGVRPEPGFTALEASPIEDAYGCDDACRVTCNGGTCGLTCDPLAPACDYLCDAAMDECSPAPACAPSCSPVDAGQAPRALRAWDAESTLEIRLVNTDVLELDPGTDAWRQVFPIEL